MVLLHLLVPEVSQQRSRLAIAQIGKTAWIPFVSADLGNLVGGWVYPAADPARNAGPEGAQDRARGFRAADDLRHPRSVALRRAGIAVALVSVATFGYTSYNANALAFPADVFPKNMVGSIWGLASLGSGFGGMLFSWLSAAVIDGYGYMPGLIGFGIMPLVAAGIVPLAMGPLVPHPEFQGRATPHPGPAADVP